MVYFSFLFFHFNLLFHFFFYDLFCTPRHLTFSVPGDCDFLVYCVILYINIYKKKQPYSQADPKHNEKSYSATNEAQFNISLVIY